MYIWRIILGLLGFVVFIIIMINLFTGGGKKPVTPVNVLKPLGDYAATDATVSFTVDGIVNGDELHRSIRITVSDNQREVDVLQGYNPQVITSKSFINNQEAFTVFLKSIGNSGFVTKNKKSKAPADPAGLCPLGFRYIMNLNQDGDDLSNLWTSSCGTAVGNSAGALSTIQTLFQDQIPAYETITSQVNLSATQ
jgi:hypothetical protein